MLHIHASTITVINYNSLLRIEKSISATLIVTFPCYAMLFNATTQSVIEIDNTLYLIEIVLRLH